MNSNINISILLIEKDIDFAKTLEKSLSEIKAFTFTLKWVSTLNTALDIISKNSFNIVLLDMFLENSDGLQTLKSIRVAESNLPIIVLTDNEDVELAVNAVRFGAQDYLIKYKLDSHLLSLAIRYAVERKRTERFQREQLHFLQSVMDNIPCPLYIKDTNLIYGACNAAFENLIGISKDRIIGKSVFDLFENQFSETIRKKELELLSGNNSQIYELAFSGNNSEIINMIFHETIHKRADGSLAGLIGVAMDISDMKNIENSLKEAKECLENKINERTSELRKTNEKLSKQIIKRKKIEKLLWRERKIFTNSPVVTFRCSAIRKTPVEYVSSNIRQYGYTPEDFLTGKMKYSDFISPSDRERIITELIQCENSEDDKIVQVFYVKKKNGILRKVHCHINVIKKKNGKIKFFDGYIFDITDWDNINK